MSRKHRSDPECDHNPILYVTKNKKYTFINKKLKCNSSAPKIKHPPDVASGGVKAVPHMAARLMKDPQL